MVIFNSYVKLPEGIPCLLVSNIFENPISVIHFRHRGSGEYAYSTNSSPGGRRSMSMSMSVPGLVNVNRKLWKITIFNGKINYKLQCSIAMLNYQRVDVDVFFDKNDGPSVRNPKRTLTWPCNGVHNGGRFSVPRNDGCTVIVLLSAFETCYCKTFFQILTIF